MTSAGLATKGGVPKKYKKCGIFHTWVDPGSKVWKTNFFDFGFSTIIESNALEMHWTPRDGRVGRSVGRSGNFF